MSVTIILRGKMKVTPIDVITVFPSKRYLRQKYVLPYRFPRATHNLAQLVVQCVSQSSELSPSALAGRIQQAEMRRVFFVRRISRHGRVAILA